MIHQQLCSTEKTADHPKIKKNTPKQTKTKTTKLGSTREFLPHNETESECLEDRERSEELKEEKKKEPKEVSRRKIKESKETSHLEEPEDKKSSKEHLEKIEDPSKNQNLEESLKKAAELRALVLKTFQLSKILKTFFCRTLYPGFK